MTRRHEDVVVAVTKGINTDRHPKPILKKLNNTTEDDKRPDVVFEINGEKWCLDVAFAKPGTERTAFEKKINKYTVTYTGNVIPLIVGYSGFIYYQSMDLL